uniref:Uncharacterized protein n=1 Tax=viral metagenome TaxID=1070528 RepID=A0A6M3J2R5_9ZZZZ
MSERGTIGLVSTEEADDGSWLEDPEVSPEFWPVHMIWLAQNNVVMDPTLSEQKQRESANIGLQVIKWDSWEVAINMSTQWHGKIPPEHFSVEFAGTLVGILSPFQQVRTCWHCGLGSPRAGDSFRRDRMFVYSVFPKLRNGQDMPRCLPFVLPAHACRGPLKDGLLRRTCGAFDWFGLTVTREEFKRSAEERLARLQDDESYLGGIGKLDATSYTRARDAQ